MTGASCSGALEGEALIVHGDQCRPLHGHGSLGAAPRQVASFIGGEAAIILGRGAIFGLILGTGLACGLVKILEGVFDPSPEQLTAPFGH